MEHGHCQSSGKSPIGAKEGAELPDLVGVSPEKIADLVLEFLKEQDQAQAAYLLYCLHKDDIAAWGEVRHILLSLRGSYQLFTAIVNVLETSAKKHLDYSYALIPGLSNTIQGHQIR